MKSRAALLVAFTCLVASGFNQEIDAQATPRERVGAILREERRRADQSHADQHAQALRSLDFDAVPVAAEWLADNDIGRAAAAAMLVVDEARGLSLIFASMPASGPEVQRIAYFRFLDAHSRLRLPVKAQARVAALQTLERVVSTANAELALLILGVTGSEVDFPLLERFRRSPGVGVQGMREASHAALARLGSAPHVESLRTELARPLPFGATYPMAVRLTRVLGQAAFSRRQELVPVVCAHLEDPAIREIDISADPAQSAVDALTQIVDGGPAASPRRSREEWTAYCRSL
jgi:hypothetical protein